MMRAHAVWAAARLGRHDLLELVRVDRSPEVCAELAALGQVPPRTDRAAVHMRRAGTTAATTPPTAPPVDMRAPTTHALAPPAHPVPTRIDPAPVDPTPAGWPTRREAPPRHERLPAQDRRHPVVPLGAVAAAAPRGVRRC